MMYKENNWNEDKKNEDKKILYLKHLFVNKIHNDVIMIITNNNNNSLPVIKMFAFYFVLFLLNEFAMCSKIADILYRH